MASVQVYIFNVGFGDAIYIRIEDDKTKGYLIDCGYRKAAQKYLEWLETRNYKNNYLILTHNHSDHINGLKTVLEKETVSKIDFVIYDTQNPKNISLAKVLREKQFSMQTLGVDEANKYISPLKIILPEKGDGNKYKNENRNSLVIVLPYDDKYLLFMGDATKEEEKRIILDKKVDLSKVVLLKLGHHGSKTSTSIELLDKLKDGMLEMGVISSKRDTEPAPPHELTKGNWGEYLTDIPLEYTAKTDGDCKRDYIEFKLNNVELREITL